MNPEDVVLQLLLAICLLGSAVITIVRSSISTAALQQLEDEEHHRAHALCMSARQENTREFFALQILGQFFILVALLLFASELWMHGASVLTVIYTGLIASLCIIVVRILLSALAERFAEYLLPFSVLWLRVAVLISFPLTFIMEQIATKISAQQSEEEAREEMEEEITAIMDEAVQEGTLDADEYRILTNIMQFGEVTVKDVMTPRNVVFSLAATKLISEVVDRAELQIYSRIPLCKDQSLDEVIGYCLTRDIYSAALHGQTQASLSTILRDVHFIPENVRLDKVLEEFLTRRQHLFLVVDEYGGVEGLITMEDVVETILGAEIVDEGDRVEDLRQLASQRRDHRVAAALQSSPASKNSSDSPLFSQ